MTSASPAAARRWHLPDRAVWVTPEAIYGTILTCAILAVASEDATDLELLVQVSAASLVLWAAHGFAVFMARHGSHAGHETTIPQAAAHAAYHSAGFLLGPAFPIGMLALGATNVIGDALAYTLAAASGILVLIGLGVVAAVERRKPWWLCAIAGIATGVEGFLMIVLKGALD